MDGNGFSLESVSQLRAKAFAQISEHAFAIDALAAATADLDAALQQSIAERTIDDQQALVTAARNLADLIERGKA